MQTTFMINPIGKDCIAYHYTSSEGFRSIINEGKLRFSRCDCLNDYRDGVVLKELYPSVALKMYEEGSISREFYESVKEYENIMYRIVERDNERYLYFIKPSFYVCCFSMEKDSLQMWQYYSKGGNYEGYNIGCRIISLFADYKEVMVYPVVYNKAQQIKKIQTVIENSYNDYNKNKYFDKEFLQNQLTEMNCYFKQECFSGENEVRAVIPWNDDLAEKYTDMKIKYRTSHGMMIPYFDLTYSKDAVQSVMIGPITSNRDISAVKNMEVVEEFVSERMECGIDVRMSQIPVRY